MKNPMRGPGRTGVVALWSRLIIVGILAAGERLELSQNSFLLHSLRSCDGTQDGVQSPETKGAMVWYRQPVVSRRLNLQDDVAASWLTCR
jgi:hypothetical protein